MRAMIQSMTAKERKHTQLVNQPSRKKRIIKGSGVTKQQATAFFTKFKKMQKMLGKLSGGGMQKMMKKMQDQFGQQ